MAKVLNDEINRCSLLWKIVNFSHCWLKKGEKIVSPAFVTDEKENTIWLLCVYPTGETNESNMVFYLQRAENCNGPVDMRISYELSLLDKDGKLLSAASVGCESFAKNNWILISSELREKFISQRETCLPNDTLTVNCKIRYLDETPVLSKLLSARTVFNVVRRTLVWKFEEFSNLKPGVKNKFKDELMDFDIVLNEGLDFDKKLIIDGILFDERIKYFSFKTAIVDSGGKNKDFGTHEFFADDLKKGVKTTLLFAKTLLEDKNRYLPNDSLSLDIEYVFSTGTISYQFCSCGIISPKETKVEKKEVEEKERKEYCIEKPIAEQTSVLATDLRSMYEDGICCDTELRILTQTYRAHKSILSARSLVFRRMFNFDTNEESTNEKNTNEESTNEKNTNEKNTNQANTNEKNNEVDITGLDEDTTGRMLLYIYTDSLEDLQLENACKLFEASKTYEILSLSSRCSSYLKNNLCSKKVCDVILLADRHKDDDLKTAAQDFILKHDKEVFGSEEWKQFMTNNIKLAADVMYRKVFLG